MGNGSDRVILTRFQEEKNKKSKQIEKTLCQPMISTPASQRYDRVILTHSFLLIIIGFQLPMQGFTANTQNFSRLCPVVVKGFQHPENMKLFNFSQRP